MKINWHTEKKSWKFNEKLKNYVTKRILQIKMIWIIKYLTLHKLKDYNFYIYEMLRFFFSYKLIPQI